MDNHIDIHSYLQTNKIIKPSKICRGTIMQLFSELVNLNGQPNKPFNLVKYVNKYILKATKIDQAIGFTTLLWVFKLRKNIFLLYI